MEPMFTDKFRLMIDNMAMVGMNDAQKEIALQQWVDLQTVLTIESLAVRGDSVSIISMFDHPPHMEGSLQLSLNHWLINLEYMPG